MIRKNLRVIAALGNFIETTSKLKLIGVTMRVTRSNSQKPSSREFSDNRTFENVTVSKADATLKHTNSSPSKRVKQANDEVSTSVKLKSETKKKPPSNSILEAEGNDVSSTKTPTRVSKKAKTVKHDEVTVKKEEITEKDINITKKSKKRKNDEEESNILDEDSQEDKADTKRKRSQKNRKAPLTNGENVNVKPKPNTSEIIKPELVIPEINIPTNKPQILRKDGPSPWNGTIEYNNKVFLGAHISAAGGLENAITNSVNIGASCFALFLKNQRQWVSKPMEEITVERFKEACKSEKFSPHLILPHGSYLMNCGSSDPSILAKSRATLLDEVQRCERLGILYYNIHPGSSCGKGTRDEAMQLIADSINWVHDQTPNSKVAIVLENMCRQGHTIGGDFSEIAEIIKRVFDQTRIGVCLDTCHALAAGYDLATSEGFNSFLEEFERVIGFRYLVAVHLNDSEGDLGCHRDRHASIGKGKIGLEGFRRIINCPRFRDIPLVLETPYVSDDYYKQEIILLKSLAEGDTVCA